MLCTVTVTVHVVNSVGMSQTVRHVVAAETLDIFKSRLAALL